MIYWVLVIVGGSLVLWFVVEYLRAGRTSGPTLTAAHMRHQVKDVDGTKAVWLEPETELHVVGESFYRDHLRALVKAGVGRNTVAWLVPEPDNPHDPNAVAVMVHKGKVGHLSRENAASWQPALLALMTAYDAPVACSADIRGKKNPGVFLRVPNDAPSHF